MAGYTVEKNLRGLDVCTLDEPVINHEASEFFIDNYSKILVQAHKMNGVDPMKVEDLVQDVMCSILDSENRGEGYSIEHSREGSIVTVADFVYGRLKAYSKNTKYSVGSFERHVSNKRCGGKVTSVVDFEIYSASSKSSDTDEMDSFQLAFNNAASYDNDIEDLEVLVGLRKDMEFCCEFDDVIGFSMRNLFKNIDLFAQNFKSEMFDRLREAVKYHDEFGTALRNVIEASCINRAAFDAILAEI